METNEKQQELETIIEAIRLTEKHYPEKVVIERSEDRLTIYSPSQQYFSNCSIIAIVNAMRAHCFIKYDENLDKVVLIIF